MSSRSNRVKAAISTSVLASAAGLALAGCGGGVEPNYQEVYCVNDQDEVVDEDMCDHASGTYGGGGGGNFFLFIGNLGGNHYTPGQRIPHSYVSKGQRVSPVDAAARAKAGLPKSGPVSSGTRIQGGIGTGKVGGKAGSVGG